MSNPIELYNVFDKANHLQPEFDKAVFEALHSWDFGWAILEPINIASDRSDDGVLSRRFSPGQKALYFFWYLDAQVTNGGLIQFYWNGYQDYIPPIITGLKLVNDEVLLQLLEKAETLYHANENKFIAQRKANDWSPLYKELKAFDELNQLYYSLHDNTMSLFETFVRNNPNEFVRF